MKLARRLGNPLPADFYLRDTREVARELLGCLVVHYCHGNTSDTQKTTLPTWLCGKIVETEAYVTGDEASHAFRGPTDRNRVMFGPPGHAYIYISYGIHTMLNLVCESEGVGEAVLIRAIEPMEGLEIMLANRGNPIDARTVTNGPGRLTQALGLNIRRDNGADVTDPKSALQILERQETPAAIVTTPRIGISVAKDLPYRYYIKGNPYVSRK